MTELTNGDALNLTGATAIDLFTSLKNNIQNGGWTDPTTPPTPGAVSASAPWMLGYDNTWQSGASGQFLYWSRLNGENAVMPNVRAFNALGSTAWTVAANGHVLGIPRKLTAAEKATFTGQSALTSNPAQYLGAALCTAPYGLKAPFAVSVTMTMPGFRGMWPALWLLDVAGEWPPEIDLFEGYCDGAFSAAAVVGTASIHTATGVGAQPDPQPAYIASDGSSCTAYINPPAGKTFTGSSITYTVVAYADKLAMFLDGVCARVYNPPSDFANVNWYLLLDSTIRPTANVPASVLPAAIPAFDVSNIVAYTMPATYGGSAPTPPPPPPPTLLTTVEVFPGAGTFQDAAGNVYSIVRQ